MSDPQPLTQLSPDFWQARYQDGTDRWDLRAPAPPFVSLLNSAAAPPPGKIAVLGAGRGHDALLFAEQGFEVIGFDFAPFAVEAASSTAKARGLNAEFLQRDIFSLETEFANQFDYVLEHTCFCAILPQQRAEYVELVRSILRPGGELIGLFWAHSRAGGPPFGVTLAELQQQFEPSFEILTLQQPTNSIEGRQQEEYLARMRVKK
jgi:SAM-dependent methyltransferase